jgi:hypothetical protein
MAAFETLSDTASPAWLRSIAADLTRLAGSTPDRRTKLAFLALARRCSLLAQYVSRARDD